MKTKQQRERDSERRKREKKRRLEQFPHARLDGCLDETGVVVEVEAGDAFWLNVMYRGEGHESPLFPHWKRLAILLDNPVELARFIGALTARYNALVGKMNAATKDVARAIQLKRT